LSAVFFVVSRAAATDPDVFVDPAAPLWQAKPVAYLRLHRGTRVFVMAVWAALFVQAVFFAPPSEDTGALMLRMFLFQGPDPWLDATFNLMGLWPLLYARILMRGTGRAILPKLPPWIGMAIGAFIILPAVALRRFGAAPDDDPTWVRRFCESDWLGNTLAAIGFLLLLYGGWFGDLAVLREWFWKDGFVHTYLLDFSALAVGYVALVTTERSAEEDPTTPPHR
jgi:hypothetical protein